MKALAWTLLLSPLFVAGSVSAQEATDETDPTGVILDDPEAFAGYNLIAPLTAKTVYLLDMQGEIVHRWETESTTEAGILLDDGHLLRWGIANDKCERFQGPGIDGGLIEELDWEGNVVWRFVQKDDYQLLHHDIALLPNGNLLFLVWEHRYTEDALEWGRDPAQVGEAGMWPDAVYEIAPDRAAGEGGEIVWEWHTWDHIVQDFDESKANYGSVPDSPGRIDINADHRGRPPLTPEEIEEQRELERQMAALGYGGEDEGDDDDDDDARRGTAPDWLHTNAIDYHPEYDLIVLSTPTLNELWVIDHSTTTEEAASDAGGRWGQGGDLLWRWGNPRNYGAGDDADCQLFFQHDPTWLPTETAGELRLLVHNNGQGRPDPPYSSADELVLPFDPERGFLREDGEPFGPAEPVWSYSDPGTFYSSFISGTQRLPNGNTLICSGAQGRVFEVNREGRVVWDFRNGLGEEGATIDIPIQSIYRAYRIPEDHPGLEGRLR